MAIAAGPSRAGPVRGLDAAAPRAGVLQGHARHGTRRGRRDPPDARRRAGRRRRRARISPSTTSWSAASPGSRPSSAPSSSSSTTSTCRSPMRRRPWASRSGRRSPGSTGPPARCERPSRPTTGSRRGSGSRSHDERPVLRPASTAPARDGQRATRPTASSRRSSSTSRSRAQRRAPSACLTWFPRRIGPFPSTAVRSA